MNSMTEGPLSSPESRTEIAPEAQSAGTRLRLAREAAQLTLDDVAQQLKLARRQVVALESDDVAALPGPTFVRGFIRNYARSSKRAGWRRCRRSQRRRWNRLRRR